MAAIYGPVHGLTTTCWAARMPATSSGASIGVLRDLRLPTSETFPRRSLAELTPADYSAVMDANLNFSVKEYKIETGKYYRWKIESKGGEEFQLSQAVFHALTLGFSWLVLIAGFKQSSTLSHDFFHFL